MSTRLPLSVIAVPIALLCACGGKSGEQVSERLQPGIHKNEVMEIVADGASVQLVKRLEAPPSGAWEEVVDDPRALSVILAATVRTDEPISEIVWLRRGDGGFAADDFYLFFDDEGILLHHQRVRSR